MSKEQFLSNLTIKDEVHSYTGVVQDEFEAVKKFNDPEITQAFGDKLLEIIPQRSDLVPLSEFSEMAVQLTSKKNKTNKYSVIPEYRPSFAQAFYGKFQSLIPETTDPSDLKKIYNLYIKGLVKISTEEQCTNLLESLSNQTKVIAGPEKKQVSIITNLYESTNFSKKEDLVEKINIAEDVYDLKRIAKWLSSEYAQFREEDVKLKFFNKFKAIVEQSEKDELAPAVKLANDDDEGFAFFSTKDQDKEIKKTISTRRQDFKIKV